LDYDDGQRQPRFRRNLTSHKYPSKQKRSTKSRNKQDTSGLVSETHLTSQIQRLKEQLRVIRNGTSAQDDDNGNDEEDAADGSDAEDSYESIRPTVQPKRKLVAPATLKSLSSWSPAKQSKRKKTKKDDGTWREGPRQSKSPESQSSTSSSSSSSGSSNDGEQKKASVVSGKRNDKISKKETNRGRQKRLALERKKCNDGCKNKENHQNKENKNKKEPNSITTTRFEEVPSNKICDDQLSTPNDNGSYQILENLVTKSNKNSSTSKKVVTNPKKKPSKKHFMTKTCGTFTQVKIGKRESRKEYCVKLSLASRRY
jgi:hypothetical protein